MAPQRKSFPRIFLARAEPPRLAGERIFLRSPEQAYNLFIFTHDESLIGGVGLSNLRRGVSESANLGYWIGEPFAQQGYMTAALPLVLAFAFERLRLHRVEAACLPTNTPSRSLLVRAGFRQEGYARQYLCIEGKWQDHLLFAILREDWDDRHLKKEKVPGTIGS